MISQKRIWFVPLVMALLSLCFSLGVTAQSEAIIHLSPLVLGINQSGVVNATIDCSGQNCALFAGTLVFDPALIQIDGVKFGSFLGNVEAGEVFVDPTANLIDNERGIVQLFALNVGTPGQSSDNTLFQLSVRSLAPGDTFLMFTSLLVADPLNNLISSTGVGTVITMQDPATTVVIPTGQGINIRLLTSPNAGSSAAAVQEGVGTAIQGQASLTIGTTGHSFPLNLQTAICSNEAEQNSNLSSTIGMVSAACISVCAEVVGGNQSLPYPVVALECSQSISAPANTYRLISNDEASSHLIADFVLHDLAFTRMAIIHDNTSVNQRLAQQVNQQFTELGGEVVATQAIDPGNISTIVAEVIAASPQVIFFAASTETSTALLQARQALDLNAIPFVGADSGTGDLTQLTQMSSAPLFVLNNASSSEQSNLALTGLSSSDPRLSDSSFISGYDAVRLLFEAIQASSRVDEAGNLLIDRQAVSRYLNRVHGFSSLSGPLYADSQGTVSVRGLRLVQTGGNQLREVKTQTGDLFPSLDEFCTVRPAQAQIAVYVGPDSTRSVRQSMLESESAVATGWAVADDGSYWWRLQPPSGSPELDRYWVRQDDVIEVGSCALMPPVPGSDFIYQPTPTLIPVIPTSLPSSQPTSQPEPTTVPGTGTTRQDSITVTVPS
jgi:ABC-type branched-subunit amino acid transport system substrate-binding protein